MKQPHQTLLPPCNAPPQRRCTPKNGRRACALPVGLGDGGDDGHRGVTADVDASFGDILDNLEMGFMGMYRAPGPFLDRRRYIFMLSGTERSATSGQGRHRRRQFVLGAAAGYALTEKFVVLGGLRYYDCPPRSKSPPARQHRDAETDESWVDPTSGRGYTIAALGGVVLNLSGDIGGFGVGSDFACRPGHFRCSSRANGALAHIVTWTWTTKAQRFNRFEYDMAFSGPALGIVFTF